MASKLILKKSSVLGKTPLVTDLEYGELALNYADGKLFYKTSSNSIANFSVGGGGGGGGGFALTANQFTGDGTQTDFTLSAAPSSIAYTVVTVGGVAQTRGSAYTVSGTTLTFTDPPAVGDEIEVLTIASATIAQGVPVGGAANSVLVKQSATDYDTAWSNQLTVSSISYSNQITSTAATGTAPFVVTSTTRVANLNVATAGTADSVAWTGITGKPTFATVATSGSYSDLSGTPTLATVATTGNYSDLSGTPDIATQISSAITTHESAVDPHTQYQTSSETLVTVATATGDIHGIVDRTQSTISFNETTREFSVAPVSGSWTYYHTGTLNTVSTTKTLTLTDTSGAKFVYIDASGNLNEHAIPDFAANVYLAYVYWNSTTGRAAIVGDERHGSKRDTTWHSAQHQNVGTVWRSGGDLSYTLNSDSAVNIGVGTPVNIADEDLLHSITHSATPSSNFQQILTGSASLEVIYLTGTAYTTTTTNTLPWMHTGNVAQYNLINTGSGSLATATEGKYITYWLLATNDLRAGRGPIKLVLGRQLNNTVDEAYAESFTEYGLSFAEQVFMYQIVVQYSSSYTNNAARIRLAGIRKILAKLATTSVAAAPAASHNALTGRSEQDAHPISAITNLQTSLDAKQDTLVSNTNIKTVNSTSLLGSGDVAVQPTLVSGTNIKTVNSTSLLGSGDVAVQPTLVSGTSIKTVNSTSLLGSGDVAVQSTLVSGTNIKTINSTSLLGSGNIAIPAYTGPAITVGTTAPVSPAVGDLWVDTN
jgi:hypothetical protein